MKHSIYKIFKNLNLLLLISFITSIVLFLFIVEQYYSYEKVKSLQNQKAILTKIIKSKEKISIIDFNSKIAMINNAIQKLQKQSEYNYISLYITKNEEVYRTNLNAVYSAIQKFEQTSRKHFKANDNEPLSMSKSLLTQPRKIVSFINRLVIKNTSHDNDSFNIFSKLFLFLLFTLLLSNIWQRKRLKDISKNISLLYSNDSDRDKQTIMFQEIDAINMRMNRKNKISDNPTMIDPITELNNNKGLIQAYSERKTSNDNNFSSLALLEIDNFSASKRVFSQDFTQEILKKVAYSISLYEQGSDIIARTEYNQFTLIFSRPSKEQLFKDVDLIRQSIADMKISSPDKEALRITVSGGFVIKQNNAPLEESVKKAKELLENAKNIGTNKVLQSKDIPKR